MAGTVTNKADGKAVIDASVGLLKEGKFTKTDANGKFIIQEMILLVFKVSKVGAANASQVF